MQSHYCPNRKSLNEVWGLCVNKKKNEFITCSDDATLRIWDYKEKRQIRCIELNRDSKGKKLAIDKKTKDIADQHKGRSVSISGNGKWIAVGMKKGPIIIINDKFEI